MLRAHLLIFWILLVYHTGAALPVLAQEGSSTELKQIFQLQEATRLAADPAGRLYVTDAGEQVVYQLSSEGDLLFKAGRPGGGEGQFDVPMDVDPTNGLVIVVADTENGRLQSFSSEFRFLDAHYLYENATSYRVGESGTLQETGARPIAVASSRDQSVFVLDADLSLVLKWDRERVLEARIGDYDQGEGALADPRDLVVTEMNLYVLDAGLDRVQVYDHFGGFEGPLAIGQVQQARSLSAWQEFILITTEEEVLVYHQRGTFVRKWLPELSEPLVDMLIHPAGLFVLTPSGLFHAPFDPNIFLIEE